MCFFFFSFSLIGFGRNIKKSNPFKYQESKLFLFDSKREKKITINIKGLQT